jgi:hypothetical protein
VKHENRAPEDGRAYTANVANRFTILEEQTKLSRKVDFFPLLDPIWRYDVT